MEININNYEAFIIDFLDGKLNDNSVAKLFVFLDKNPTIKAEFDLLNDNQMVLEPDILPVDFSNLLKAEKNNVANYSNQLIALLENDLNPEETKTLIAEINAYPELAAEYELFKQTKLVAEKDIIFANKQLLIKKIGFVIIPLFTRYSAIAAVFIAVIMVFYFRNNNNQYQVADKIDNNVVKSKQDSIFDVVKSKNNVPKLLQKDHEKEMLAFGGVNAAAIQKHNKKIVPTVTKNLQHKKTIKESPLNGGNNQTVVPSVPVNKKASNTNLLATNELKDNNKADEKPIVVKEKVEITTIPSNSVLANTKNEANFNINNMISRNIALGTYVKEQLKITAQSEVIAVNKPANSNENISFAESIGLNMLSLFNKVSNRDVKVKKTYNNDGELEKVRLVATGW